MCYVLTMQCLLKLQLEQVGKVLLALFNFISTHCGIVAMILDYDQYLCVKFPDWNLILKLQGSDTRLCCL